MNKKWMAACGLDCETCEIRLAPFDPDAAKVIVNWFKRQGWLTEREGLQEVIERKMFCTGCLGSRESHWSADCWILACCVDQHDLENCSQCVDFPCDRLVVWSKENKSYTKALKTLKTLRDSR